MHGSRQPCDAAFSILRIGFLGLAFIAGVDKLTRFLPPAEVALAPLLTRLSPFGTEGLLWLMGVVQLGIGVLLIVLPRMGASAVVVWASLSAVNWMLLGNWQQVLSGAALLAAACAFVQLTRAHEAGQTAARRAREPRGRARLPRTDTLASVTDD
jgi:hypothetical protein